MANILSLCTSLVGGGADAVDGIAFASLANNDIVIATVSDLLYIYKFNSTSADAESSPDIIKPDDAGASNGRHILQNPYAGNIDHDALVNFLATEHKISSVIRQETGTALYIELRTSDPASPVTGSIWVRTDL